MHVRTPFWLAVVGYIVAGCVLAVLIALGLAVAVVVILAVLLWSLVDLAWSKAHHREARFIRRAVAKGQVVRRDLRTVRRH